jgi:Mg2+-importing ATPase
MARRRVIVKQLASIENLGSMNVLCSDKTGTLTEGVVKLQAALDAQGEESEKVLFHAYLNASYETGFTNPIDESLRAQRLFDLSDYQKLDEVPYDFIRKRLSVLVARDGVARDGKRLMVTKGALRNVLEVCSYVETSEGAVAGLNEWRERIDRRFEDLSAQGFRTLGVAYRDRDLNSRMTKEDETGMTFLGFLAFFDPPKAGIVQAIGQLKELGISLKLITGDNRLVAANVAREVIGSGAALMVGTDLSRMSDEALRRRVNEVDIFAEVEPNQKERIILALRKSGNVVGYLGDGINDASALHAADVGISVNIANVPFALVVGAAAVWLRAPILRS